MERKYHSVAEETEAAQGPTRKKVDPHSKRKTTPHKGELSYALWIYLYLAELWENVT
jgi:hypothetical protein